MINTNLPLFLFILLCVFNDCVPTVCELLFIVFHIPQCFQGYALRSTCQNLISWVTHSIHTIQQGPHLFILHELLDTGAVWALVCCAPCCSADPCPIWVSPPSLLSSSIPLCFLPSFLLIPSIVRGTWDAKGVECVFEKHPKLMEGHTSQLLIVWGYLYLSFLRNGTFWVQSSHCEVSFLQ